MSLGIQERIWVKAMKVLKPVISMELNEKDSIESRISEYVADEIEIGYCLFQNQTVSNVDAARVEFKACKFINCKFVNCKFNKAVFSDIVFNTCDLSNCSFSECTLHKVKFENCRMTGSGFREAYIRNTTFLQCRCDYIDLSRSNMKAAQFINCDMANAYISYSKLSVEFKDCSLVKSNLFHTPLHGLNFTSCNIQGICVAVEDLKGAIVNSEQAAELSLLLGLIIDRQL